MEVTKQNVHGETITIKIKNGVIMVHHEDCTNDFITLNKLFYKFILDAHELVLIYNGIKELYAANELTPEKLSKGKKKFEGEYGIKLG